MPCNKVAPWPVQPHQDGTRTCSGCSIQQPFGWRAAFTNRRIIQIPRNPSASPSAELPELSWDERALLYGWMLPHVSTAPSSPEVLRDRVKRFTPFGNDQKKGKGFKNSSRSPSSLACFRPAALSMLWQQQQPALPSCEHPPPSSSSPLSLAWELLLVTKRDCLCFSLMTRHG